MDTQKSRRLAAIMFTDIVGYTALMQQDEAAAAKVRALHRKVFEALHQKHKGEILQYFGDGTLSVFHSGVKAVECAIAIQQALNQDEPVPLRIGLHIGDIVFDGTEIYGDGVNVASRIESMGVAGAILVSGYLNAELKNQAHITTTSLGYFEFKNVDEPIELFAISNKGIVVPKRSELKGKGKAQTKSIAVLPFVNMSANADNEYFSDGMTEEIINALAKIKNLKVTSRTSSFFFKNKNIPIRQIGQELKVSTILEGSIRLAGNKMRITAQLIDVNDDFHFWSETFDRSIDDIFAVQDEISLLIADRLREHLGHFDIEEHLVEAPEISVDSYKKYLESRYHILKMTKADLDHGIAILEQIIQDEPRFALAYIGMHLAYTLLGTIGFMPSKDAFEKADPYLEKAIELDPNLPESQLHLSYISFLQDWDLATTYKHLNKSFDIRPTVEYYQSMASTLGAEGNFAAAENYIETALQIDPFSNINYHLKGYIAYIKRDYPEALEAFKKSKELNPMFMASTLYYGQTLILMGKKEESLAYFQNLPEDGAADLMKIGGLCMAYAALGKTEEALNRIEKLEAALGTELTERAMNILINCYTLLGDNEKAFKSIENAIQLKLPMLVYLANEPMLLPLHSFPKFKELAQQILGEPQTLKEPKRKYKKSLLDENAIKAQKAQLQQLMDEDQPYLNPDLTLRDLAQMLDLPPNHLSQLLNEGFDQNFSEFVNRYRLETFKIKAADQSNRHLTILALAYESGFNSKTVFNTFFKKVMGKTPSAYWKEINA